MTTKIAKTRLCLTTCFNNSDSMTKEIIGVEEWNNGLVIRYQVVVLTVELIQHNPLINLLLYYL